LNAYVAVHDAIFSDAATFKSFVKNILGRGVPMSVLLEKAERLVPVWDAIRIEARDFRQSTYTSLAHEERRYFDILSQYIDALCDTVRALVARQQLLNQGAMGGSRNSMTWNALQEKQRTYEESIHRYMAIGQELNAAAPVIFR
jgi:hypothetical protein